MWLSSSKRTTMAEWKWIAYYKFVCRRTDCFIPYFSYSTSRTTIPNLSLLFELLVISCRSSDLVRTISLAHVWMCQNMWVSRGVCLKYVYVFTQLQSDRVLINKWVLNMLLQFFPFVIYLYLSALLPSSSLTYTLSLFLSYYLSLFFYLFLISHLSDPFFRCYNVMTDDKQHIKKGLS